MNSAGNSLVQFLKQDDVDGNVDTPPTPCLRTANPSAYLAARVERTGRLRRRASRQAGLAGWKNDNDTIFHSEQHR